MAFNVNSSASNNQLSFVGVLSQMGPLVGGSLNEQPVVSADEKALLENIVPQLMKETSSLDCAHLPNQELSEKTKQLLVLKMLKVFIQTVVSAANLPGHQNDAQISSAVTHFANVISISPLEALMTSPELLPEWVDEILSCQKIIKPFLPPILFQQEGSKGLTYKIKKEGKTCGYLFGTMHYLVIPELQKAAELSQATCKRLLKCAVLGTEIAIRNDDGTDSVERKLMEVAKKYAIANFGIDTPEREAIIDTMGKTDEPEISDVETRQCLVQMAESYRYGNIEQMKMLAPKLLNPEIELKRDTRMTENVDTFLKVAAILGKKRGEAPNRPFFGVGLDHLLREGPGSMLSMLSEKGWTLQLA